MTDIVQNLSDILVAIHRAEKDGGREPGSVSLIAISKTCGPEMIRPALESGQRVFGENYVQESAGKWPALREEAADVELHLVGPLQSNKVREALRLFDVIHTLDRPSLAAALAKEMPREFDRTGRRPRCLVQVNTGEEPQKGGIMPADADAFVDRCRAEYGLVVEGLMCIPPVDDLPSPHFGLLRMIAERNNLPLLSMGMSADFQAAIQLGATHVRVGTAIFGKRVAKA